MLTKPYAIKNAVKLLASAKSNLYFSLKLPNVPKRFDHTLSIYRFNKLRKVPEIIPGISSEEFLARRTKLMRSLIQGGYNKSKAANHIVVVSSTGAAKSDGRNVDLIYLTGIRDTNCCFVMVYVHGRELKTILFHDPEQPKINLVSTSIDVDKASKLLDIDEVYSMKDITSYLQTLFKYDQYKIWYDDDYGDPELVNTINELATLPGVPGYDTPHGQLQGMRLIKSVAEVELLKKTCDITANAFNHAMAICRPDIPNYAIKNIITQECVKQGMENVYVNVEEGLMFESKHLPENLRKSLLIVDAGCEFNGYTAGITRTWPKSGEFTPRQKLLYSALHKVQQQVIKNISQGTCQTLGHVYSKIRSSLSKELRNISFMKNGTIKDIFKIIPAICKGTSADFVGMNENGERQGGRNAILVPGMVLSLRPGLVIPAERQDVAPEYRGMSVQIQDNILVTENGVDILSYRCYESPNEIEQIVGSAGQEV